MYHWGTCSRCPSGVPQSRPSRTGVPSSTSKSRPDSRGWIFPFLCVHEDPTPSRSRRPETEGTGDKGVNIVLTLSWEERPVRIGLLWSDGSVTWAYQDVYRDHPPYPQPDSSSALSALSGRRPGPTGPTAVKVIVSIPGPSEGREVDATKECHLRDLNENRNMSENEKGYSEGCSGRHRRRPVGLPTDEEGVGLKGFRVTFHYRDTHSGTSDVIR